MKNVALSLLALFAVSTVACGGASTATRTAAAPIEVNAADWTPPGEQQMTLPDAPVVAHHEEAQATSALRPTVFSEGKKGSLVVLPTKRAN
ncbi:MAG: hypothetical protein U0174_13300 [Polyangiaceae bacterium]